MIAQFPQLSIDMWIEILLMAVIVVLLGVILVGRGGYLRRRKLETEIKDLNAKIGELETGGPAGEEVDLKQPAGIFEFVRDLEVLRCAIAGSKICEKSVIKKYKISPGPQLLKKILARAKIEPHIKEKLADEFLVGEVGRGMLKSFNKGASIEKASADAGVPVMVGRGQVRRLQVLGYLDNRLKPTELGWRALK